MELQYIESNEGRKKLKKVKQIDLCYLLFGTLIPIVSASVYLSFDNTTFIGIILFIIINSIFLYTVLYIRKIHMKKFIEETLTQEICLDGYINLHIYNIKKFRNNPNSQKMCNYSLLNIIDAYVRKGDFENSNSLIRILETREIDHTIRAYLIQYKVAMASVLNDIEEFNIQSAEFEKVSDLIPEAIKNQIALSIELHKCIIENNVDRVNTICDELDKKKALLNKIMASYYRGVILEKNNNDDYIKYYKFVEENGKDLYVAKVAAQKLKGTYNK